MAIGNLAKMEQRRVVRDEVLYRARGRMTDGRELALLIVNISPCGLMARCDPAPGEGARIRVILPAIGATEAEVRWSLGGRIGCEFVQAVPLASYYESLSTMLRG